MSAIVSVDGVTPASTTRVIVLVDEMTAYECLADALRGRAVIERAQGWTTLVERMSSAPPPIVALGVNGGSPGRTESDLRELRRLAAGTKLVLFCPLNEASLDALLRLQGWLADDLVVPGVHDVASIRRRVLAWPDLRAAVMQLRGLLAGRIVRKLVPMLDWCWSQAEHGACQRLMVKEMARDAELSRVEVERRFARTRTATPSGLIAWVRVLLAAQLLETRRSGLATIADEIGLSSAGALSRLVRRKTGLTPGQIHRHDGVMLVTRMFRDVFGPKDGNGPGPSSEVQRPIMITADISNDIDVGATIEPFHPRRARRR